MKALEDSVKKDNEEVVLSYYEYTKLIDGLKPYKQFKEIKPLAEAIERTLNLYTVYM